MRNTVLTICLVLCAACGTDGPAAAPGFAASVIDEIESPTALAWGSDGRLYVARLSGRITAYRFDDDYAIEDTQVIDTLTGLDNHYVLGLSGNPFDAPGTVTIYVAHSELFGGGGCPPASLEYSGRISALSGPDFDTATPVVTGLPVSNGQHGVNAVRVDHGGDLLINIGGVTNAGVPSCSQGGTPESPLSGAIVKARLSDAMFDGAVTYVERSGGAPNNDAVDGDIVELEGSADVEVFAAGFRNPFNLVLTMAGRIYAMDNGPNAGEGDASTGPMTQEPVATAMDELNLVEEGAYYGHPNRNRGIDDARQNVYYGPEDTPGPFTQAPAHFKPSSNALAEYRADVFGGLHRGDLIVGHWIDTLTAVTLSADGETVLSQEPLLDRFPSIGIVTGPGGAILGADHLGDKLRLVLPAGAPPGAWDIHPWRAPAAGGNSFVIGGLGFGSLADTTVTIGGNAAPLTRVSNARIEGTIPEETSPTTALLDVVVTTAGRTHTLEDAFRYLLEPGMEP